MKNRIFILLFFILYLSVYSFSQGRPTMLTSMRQGFHRNDSTEDFVIGEVKGTVKNKAVLIVKPEYPAAARQSGAEGIVRVQVTIDEEGNVITAKTVTGETDLVAAAEDAARRSKFVLARDPRGQPVQSDGILTYTFTIKKAGWTKIGYGLSALDRLPVGTFSIPMTRKAISSEWADEIGMLNKLDVIRRSEPPRPDPVAVIPILITRSTTHSSGGRGSASSTSQGTILLPLPPATVEQISISRNLITALQMRLANDKLGSWQFNLGVDLSDALELSQGRNGNAENVVKKYIDTMPEGVEPAVVSALKTLELNLGKDRSTPESFNAVTRALTVIMSSK